MSFRVVSICTVPVAITKKDFEKLGVDFLEKPAPTEEEIIHAARDADAVMTTIEPFTRRVITNLKSCRLILTPKMGYDNIDVAAATDMGICVSNISGLSTEEVSDHTMALLLACARKVLGLDKMVRTGKWRVFHGPEMQGKWRGISQVRGRTLGLIGFGRISRALVPKARGLGLRILAHDPYVLPEVMDKMGVEVVGLNQLLKESDFVSLHARLTPQSWKMVGLEQFKLMKPTAYLINTARGALVDEEALCLALTQGYIAGAALDVMMVEPMKMDNPLLKLDNVIFTGHSAHYSDRVWAEVSQHIIEEVVRIVSGEWPRGWVNPEVEAKFIAKWGKSKSMDYSESEEGDQFEGINY